MPSGQRPKVYDAPLVDAVRRLYGAGHTQSEVAQSLGLTQKVVYNVMRRHAIQTRPAIKRDQRGPLNSTWKGPAAGYQALHVRVAVERGSPAVCEECGTTTAKAYDWANLTGNYADVNDYKRMCRSCHAKFDQTIENIRKGRSANA